MPEGYDKIFDNVVKRKQVWNGLTRYPDGMTGRRRQDQQISRRIWDVQLQMREYERAGPVLTCPFRWFTSFSANFGAPPLLLRLLPHLLFPGPLNNQKPLKLAPPDQKVILYHNVNSMTMSQF